MVEIVDIYSLFLMFDVEKWNPNIINALQTVTYSWGFCQRNIHQPLYVHVIITPSISASGSQKQNSTLGEHIFAFVGKAGSVTMLITRLELENIKSYRHAVVDFRRGTTAISGANGAGKTTLVEAIGFALFDYMPYSASRFVREGEKFGRIVVQLIGSDDRRYTVERRCGSGSRWFIYDEEADYRVAEQSADVLDTLHDLFDLVP